MSTASVPTDKRVRLCRVAGNDRCTDHNIKKTYPDRETWKAECTKDILAWSLDPAVVHLPGCKPEDITLVDTILMGDSIGAIFVHRCPCKRAEVVVSQLN